MSTLTTSYADLPPRAAVRRFLHTRFGRFLAAYLEMTLSMLVGMQVFAVVWDGLWPGLTRRPDVMALTMAFDMTLGMALWMWVRRHRTRHIVEMSAVMVAPFLVLLVPYRVGALDGGALLTWGHVAMFALMAAYLALRPHAADHTTGAHSDTAGTAAPPRGRAAPTGPRTALASASLLVGGAALAVVSGVLHPHDELPNAHEAVFAEYARSEDWLWVHDLQWLSAALVLTGLILLSRALQRAGTARALVRVGDAAAAATGALIAVNMAVDGVALKRAVDAWAAAGPDDRAGRFAVAEGVRWLEWGVNSFFTVMLGVTVLVVAAGLLRQARLGDRVRLAGVTGALAGVLLVVNGLAVGAHGFEPSPLPRLATVLYVVMALGVPALDRAAGTRVPSIDSARADSEQPLASR